MSTSWNGEQLLGNMLSGAVRVALCGVVMHGVCWEGVLLVRWILPVCLCVFCWAFKSTDVTMSPCSGVEEQPSESERYGDLEGGLSTYGVVKRKRDNDMDLHSNKQVCEGSHL